MALSWKRQRAKTTTEHEQRPLMHSWIHLWGRVWSGAEASYLCRNLLGQCLELGGVGVLVCVFEHLVGDAHGAAVHLLDPHIFPDCRMTQTRLECTPPLWLHKFCLVHHLLGFFCVFCAAAFHLIFGFVHFFLLFVTDVFFPLLCLSSVYTRCKLLHPSGTLVSTDVAFIFRFDSSSYKFFMHVVVYQWHICHFVFGNLKRTAAAQVSFLLICIFYLHCRRQCLFVCLLTWYLKTSIDFRETQSNVKKQETNLFFYSNNMQKNTFELFSITCMFDTRCWF